MTETHECIFGPLLSPLHDGELSDERSEEVLQHIRTCGVCAAELAGMRRFSGVFHAAPPAPFSFDAETRLNRAIDQQLAEADSDVVPTRAVRLAGAATATKAPRHLSYVRLISSLAAALFLVAIVRVSYLQYNKSDSHRDLNSPTKSTVLPAPDSKPSGTPAEDDIRPSKKQPDRG